MTAPGRRRGAPPANPKAAIQDWLTLVEPDGAFLTPTELNAVFPHGFEQMPAEHRTELRAQLAELDSDTTARARLHQWLLATVLDWEDQLADGQRIPATAVARAAEHGSELRPTQVLLEVDDPNTARLGVFVWPFGTRLDRRSDPSVVGDTWPASPVQRAETWCREAGVPLALVSDDDHWALVWAPRGAPAASCRWTVADLADERILQAGLVSLLGARRFFAVADDETIEALFRKAADAEAEITKGLGTSVRRSVELLVAAMSRDDVAHDGQVLADVPNTDVYEAAVIVMMRLVFLLFAEERRLLPAEDPLWAESYSVLTLREDLRKTALRDGEDALERRSTAWHRLLATFRAVHSGANHDRLTLPAYGGSLFDPDRFPFLEGRRAPDHVIAGDVDLGPPPDAATGPGHPVAIDDRTVLAILDALLTIEVKVGRAKVAQRVSYKALDVEQIGHCYEGLLDHGCAPIDVLSLGLVGSDGAEPEIAITDLETRLTTGTDALLDWLADKTRCNKTPTALAQLLANQPEGVDLARLRAACGHDDAIVERVLPFWGLIRGDLRGLPIVLLPGSQYVTQTSTRRAMGAQYTTKALAEEVARYALEPLVYEPGPQNEPDLSQWRLRTPHEILALRVCDPAVGSGAILTAAGRYLADRLVEAVAEHGPGSGLFADRLATLAAAPVDEQTILARREIVDHCLYGVDKNPVAAEMAKLSLWLTTMARERPFTFLDHAIQVGDSLLGITDLDQLRWLHLDPAERKGVRGFESIALDQRIKEATELARRLQAMSVVTIRDALDENREEIERRAALEVLHGVATDWLRTDLPDEPPMPWDRQCLHWPLAFPEVFLQDARTGFDAIVANPPFLGGKRISGANGVAYREHLVAAIADGASGSADLVSYFLLRMCGLATSVGTLATNTVSQGDTREVGLDSLTAAGWTIHRAVRSEPWPNEASVEIAKVWVVESNWEGSSTLDGRSVERIASSLQQQSRVDGIPQVLVDNSARSFIGSYLWGEGFVMTPEAAAAIIETDPRSEEVLMPFLSGRDLNHDPQQKPSRWVINFRDWPEERARAYPACFDIVERLVKPVRSKVKRAAYRDYWWQYAEPGPGRDAAISGLERVLALTLVSKLALPAWIPPDYVVAHKCGVFAYDDDGHFGLLSSGVHWWWAVRWSSSLGGVGNINYSPTDVFETFPQPKSQSGRYWEAIADAGQALDQLRVEMMIGTGLGLTKTYNRVHNPNEADPDVVQLRGLHVDLDHAVRNAYGWSDLALDHHHWETPQGMRFTVSPEAKDELLDRLLELNHERYAAEVAAGLHEKKAKKSAKPVRAAGAAQGTLL